MDKNARDCSAEGPVIFLDPNKLLGFRCLVAAGMDNVALNAALDATFNKVGETSPTVTPRLPSHASEPVS